MKVLKFLLFAALLCYSAALLGVDFTCSQEHARGYFSDIVDGVDYPLPYYALFGINTTLTVVLLSGISILFAVCIGCGNRTERGGKPLFFLWSQFFFFLYLTCDERLLIHEKAGLILGMEDAFLLIGLGIIELLLLFVAGDVMKQGVKLKGCLLVACAFFAAMVFIDAFLPPRMPGRLALEDLSKTWAIVFLFMYAWHFSMGWISDLNERDSNGN